MVTVLKDNLPLANQEIKVTVLDTKEYRKYTSDASGVACIHELCEDVDVKIEVEDGACKGSTITFYRVEAKITQVNFPLTCS